MNRNSKTLGNIACLLAAGAIGGAIGRWTVPVVHAQDRFAGITNCTTVVPQTWGDFKGASDYGLAFQDAKGVVRFVLHPACANVNAPAEPPAALIDLKVERN